MAISVIKWVLWSGLIALVGLLVWPHLFLMPVNDEPSLILQGWMTAQGQLPYRDFFEFITPGIYYVIAVVVQLCGGELSVVALRLAGFLIWLLSTALVLLMAKSYLPRQWCWILALSLWSHLLLPIGLLGVNHHLYSTACALACVWFLWKPLSQSGVISFKHTIRAGFFLGLTLLLTQSLGVMLTVALIMFFIIRRQSIESLKTLVVLGGMAILPLGVVTLYYLQQGAFSSLWQATVLWPFQSGYMQTTSSWYLYDAFPTASGLIAMLVSAGVFSMQGLVAILSLCRLAMVVILPLLGILGMAGIWLKEKTVPNPDLILLWLVGLAFLLATFSNANVFLMSHHLAILSLLSFVVLFWYLQGKPVWSRWISGGLLTILLVHGVVIPLTLFQAMEKRPRVLSHGTREASFYAPVSADFSTERIQHLNFLVKYLQRSTRQNEAIVVLNWSPVVYLLADRQNPTRYTQWLAGYHTANQTRELIQSIKQQRPAIIIYDHADQRLRETDLRFQNWENQHDTWFASAQMQAVIQQNYSPLFLAAPYLVFQLKSAQ